MKPTEKSKIIGIDPGKETGIAIYDVDLGNLDVVYSSDFWGAIKQIDEIKDQIIAVIVELPNSKKVWHDTATKKGSIQKTSVNVGSVIREAELIVSYLHTKGITCITQHPKGKTNSDVFSRITGWEKRTNQHGRDAAMLCLCFSKKSIEKIERCLSGES